jgi:hypothetical protein
MKKGIIIMMRKAGLVALALGALVFINSGCNMIGIKKKEREPAAPRKMQFVHTVKYSGETLSIISKWYTGDVNNWKILANDNPHIDYNKMVAGDRIFIPENLMKTREPLTKEFIDSFYKEKKPASKTETPPENEEGFDLIGPK